MLRRWRARRALRRFFHELDGRPKTDADLLEEAALWERYGAHTLAARLRETAAASTGD